MNARFYDPNSGRFLSQDTYTGNAYEPMSQHLYSYVGNNPINYIDPTGHFWLQVTATLVGAAIGAGSQMIANHIQGNDLMEGVGAAAIGGGTTGLLMSLGVPGNIAGAAGSAAGSIALEAHHYMSGDKSLSSGSDVKGSVINVGVSTGIGWLLGGSKKLTSYNRGAIVSGVKKLFGGRGINLPGFKSVFTKNLGQKTLLNLIEGTVLGVFIGNTFTNLAGTGVDSISPNSAKSDSNSKDNNAVSQSENHNKIDTNTPIVNIVPAAGGGGGYQQQALMAY